MARLNGGEVVDARIKGAAEELALASSEVESRVRGVLCREQLISRHEMRRVIGPHQPCHSQAVPSRATDI